MRQAGRYMPEYRQIRSRHTLLEICRQPELATEVTLQPVRAHGVDAAILFADILLLLEPMGAPFEFAKGEGPVVHEPIRTPGDVGRLRIVDAEEGLPHVLEAIRLIRRELDGKTPLIGFAGAPFTLASYLIEGGRSSNYSLTKRFMFSEPAAWNELMSKLAETTRRYLLAQVRAGAQAVQLFDSWVGALAPEDYREHILPHVAHILRDVEATGVPVIHFGTGTATLLELQKQAGGTVIGVDHRQSLSRAHRMLGESVAYQGNLEPMLLLAPWPVLEKRARAVVDEGLALPGHVFNLGHGIVPETDPDMVSRLVALVHEVSER